MVRLADVRIGVEVKTPSPDAYRMIRDQSSLQYLSRLDDEALRREGFTLPRDNPVKDFLASANEKFKPFRKADPNFYGVLVVVWDDYINAPIAALLAPSSGLFTPNSFARDGAAQPLKFEYVDAVVLIRQQHQFRWAAADKGVFDGRTHVMDFGKPGSFPFNIYVTNPLGRMPPETVLTALHAIPRDETLGAEYGIGDFVKWDHPLPDSPIWPAGRQLHGGTDTSNRPPSGLLGSFTNL
jgi:hypothetical protein